MNDVFIAQALIEAFHVLETTGEGEIDPDVAVRGMENIAASLLQMDAAAQVALRENMKRIAQSSQDEAYMRFADSLPDMIGLAENQ